MCGIAGIVSWREHPSDETFRQIVDLMTHRGPDDAGIWSETADGAQVQLGHRRLSIIDLSSAGHQPMVSQCGRYVLVYNGELYNYLELRSDLEALGIIFSTQSDTEVFLQGLIEWGADALKRFNGMWGFAFYDREKRELLLGRDRFGKKPLYYYEGAGRTVFASEIKSVLAAAGKRFALEPNVVKAYLAQNLMDTDDRTFYQDIYKVPPGHVARIALDPRRPIECSRYWHIEDETPFQGTESQLIETVRELFLNSVAIRLRSDVPVGVLLSGGLDSSAIVAALRQLRDDDGVLILSSTSEDQRFDESPFIDAVANHLNLPVRKFSFDHDFHDLFDLLSTVVWHHDEPICNFTILAHYLLMQKAREFGVTVLLNGQGADESLCGYKKYFGFYLQSQLKQGALLPFAKNFYSLYKQGTVLNQFNLSEAKRYFRFLSPRAPSMLGPKLRDEATEPPISLGLVNGSVINRQIADVYRFSVPVINHYEDRNSMALSREIRVPFLDYRLVSLLVQLPVEYKLRDGWTKWILRKAMEPYLPESITWRKDKQHFVNSGGEMLKHALREQVLEYMNPDSLIFSMGLVDHQAFGDRYQRFSQQKDGGSVSFKEIFTPLALEVWLRKFEHHVH
jgi:asparagine synthase (glutamine-hydrolysing)